MTYTAQTFYRALDIAMPAHRRQYWNGKAKDITNRQMLLNVFTGKGGLHGLRWKDFGSFKEYTLAKQSHEMGQFFTPAEICRTMVEMLEIEPGAVVADICSGKGTFFNYLKGCTIQGVEKDKLTCELSRKLFSKARIQWADMRDMHPLQLCHYIVGNPPFNLPLQMPQHPLSDERGTVLSQALYLDRCHQNLKPGGFLAFVCPDFKKSSHWIKGQESKLAAFVSRSFRVLAVVHLPRNTFDHTGARDFPTKVLIYQKREPGEASLESKPFEASFQSRKRLLKQWRGSAIYPDYLKQKRELDQ